MKKKILSVLLAAVLTVFALPIAASAAMANNGIMTGDGTYGLDIDNNSTGVIIAGNYTKTVYNKGGLIAGGTFHKIVDEGTGRYGLKLSVSDLDVTSDATEYVYKDTNGVETTYLEMPYNTSISCTLSSSDPCFFLPSSVTLLKDGKALTAGQDYSYDASTGTLTIPKELANYPLTLEAAGVHSWGEPTWNWSGDYTSATAIFVCQGNSEFAQDVPATSITPNLIQAADCTNNSITEYTAEVTFEGETYTDTEQYVGDDMLGHSFTNYVFNNDATCTKDGTETATCDRCSVTDLREAAGTMLPHTLTEVKEKKPTCTEPGNTAYWYCETCGTYFSDAAATNPVTSESTVQNPLGHSFTKYVSDNNASCTKDGTETATCDRCSATDIRDIPGSALGHKLTETKEKKPTCTEAGNSAYWYCETCKKYFSDANATQEIQQEDTVQDALGHSFTKYTADNNASCTKNATETAKCDRCSATNTKEIAGTMLPHKLTKSSAVAPTCTKEGRTAYWRCDSCKKYFGDKDGTREVTVEQTILKPTGHEAEVKNAVSATCAKEGYSGDKVCKHCGTVLEKGTAIAKLSHNYQNGKCKVCGAVDPNLKTNTPKTGDSRNTVLWIGLLVVSGAGLLGVTAYSMRKKKQMK